MDCRILSDHRGAVVGQSSLGVFTRSPGGQSQPSHGTDLLATARSADADRIVRIVIVIIILALIVIAVIATIVIRNGMVGARNRVDEAWSGIDVQLKRRHDLVPNLVETVKGYATHEAKVFEATAEARSNAMKAASDCGDTTSVKRMR